MPESHYAAKAVRYRALPAGFTLVELLVVIGIIALLISILLPTLGKARKQANAAACGSNMKQIYYALQIYSTENRSWLFPVGENSDRFGRPDPNGKPSTLGTNFPPDQRWPPAVKAFQIKVPNPVLYADPQTGATKAYTLQEYRSTPAIDQQRIFVATAYTPKVLICPQDLESAEAHSYVLNQHMADERIRFGTSRLGTAGSSSNVVVMGEKQTDSRDYYMEEGDFEKVVEEQRHGIKLGSNYLFMDGHVDNRPPKTVSKLLDPWANIVTDPPPTTP